jgi:hypothetical protein
MMKTLRTVCLILMVFIFSAVSLQAQMMVTFKQKDSVLLTVKNREKKFLTSSNETFFLDNEQVHEKASELQGQTVHILYYEMGEEKHCTDLRPSGEAPFDIPAS